MLTRLGDADEEPRGLHNDLQYGIADRVVDRAPEEPPGSAPAAAPWVRRAMASGAGSSAPAVAYVGRNAIIGGDAHEDDGDEQGALAAVTVDQATGEQTADRSHQMRRGEHGQAGGRRPRSRRDPAPDRVGCADRRPGLRTGDRDVGDPRRGRSGAGGDPDRGAACGRGWCECGRSRRRHQGARRRGAFRDRMSCPVSGRCTRASFLLWRRGRWASRAGARRWPRSTPGRVSSSVGPSAPPGHQAQAR